MCPVGEYAAGLELIDLLKRIEVDASGLIRSDSRPTTTKTRLVGLAQHRHRQQLLRLDEACFKAQFGTTPKQFQQGWL